MADVVKWPVSLEREITRALFAGFKRVVRQRPLTGVVVAAWARERASEEFASQLTTHQVELLLLRVADRARKDYAKDRGEDIPQGWIDLGGAMELMRQQTMKITEAWAVETHGVVVQDGIREMLLSWLKRFQLLARNMISRVHLSVLGWIMGLFGLDEYMWLSRRDKRVRELHVELDGQWFSWSSGGHSEEGHPGEPPNCRCFAVPKWR